MAIFKVAAHTGDNNNGYIEYNTETKELGVHLNDEAVNERAREYLTTERVLHQYTDLSQYKTISAVPTSSLETLKLGHVLYVAGDRCPHRLEPSRRIRQL